MNPYMIQRLHVKTVDREAIVGLDSFLRYDYMGSAEFEFGALQDAAHKLASIATDLHVVPFTRVGGVDEKDQVLFYLVASRFDSDAARMLQMCMDRKHRTQDFTGIPDAAEGARKYDGWWDLEHNWLAFITREHADLMVYAAQAWARRWKK